MDNDIRAEFERLVKQYVKDLREPNADPYGLLESLVDDLVDARPDDNWQGSEC